MKRRIAGLLLMLAALAAVAGCSKPGLAGKWLGSRMMKGVTAKIVMTFEADGKFKQTTSVENSPMPMALTVAGTYTTKDGTLSLTPASSDINGVTSPITSTRVVSFTYKVDGDNLTITETGGTQSLSLTRVKK